MHNASINEEVTEATIKVVPPHHDSVATTIWCYMTCIKRVSSIKVVPPHHDSVATTIWCYMTCIKRVS